MDYRFIITAILFGEYCYFSFHVYILLGPNIMIYTVTSVFFLIRALSLYIKDLNTCFFTVNTAIIAGRR